MRSIKSTGFQLATFQTLFSDRQPEAECVPVLLIEAGYLTQ